MNTGKHKRKLEDKNEHKIWDASLGHGWMVSNEIWNRVVKKEKKD